MTEKRYSKMMNHYGTSRTYCTGIYDNQNNRELQNSNQVITELNALNDENKQLQKDCTALIYNNQEYRKENEQLRKELENNIASYKKCNRRVFDLIDKKIKEVDTIGAEVLKDLRRELME